MQPSSLRAPAKQTGKRDCNYFLKYLFQNLKDGLVLEQIIFSYLNLKVCHWVSQSVTPCIEVVVAFLEKNHKIGFELAFGVLLKTRLECNH